MFPVLSFTDYDNIWSTSFKFLSIFLFEICQPAVRIIKTSPEVHNLIQR
jgi:hypothetical protein